MAIIKEFTNYDGSEVLYPVTVAQAVYIDQNTPITNNLLTTSDKSIIQNAQLEWQHYQSSNTKTYLRIKINSTGAWMLSFTVNLYSSYEQHRIQISGYNYASTKTWYSPRAQLLSSTSLTSIDVTFAKDGDNDLSVYIPVNGQYSTALITDVVNGNTQVKTSSLFTLTRVTDADVPTENITVITAVMATANSTSGVGRGGTGATSFTSGELLIGNGAGAIGTRAIKNITSKGNLGWTNANTDIYIPTINTIAYWDGRYNSSTSNLAYCNKGAFGTLATKNSLTASEVGAEPTITGAATSITSDDLTASRVLISNTSGKVAVSAITSTELGYLDGVTSDIQTQINSKQATITGAASSISSDNLTASRALVSNSSGKVVVSDVTSTELGYLDGVTSAIQNQLDGKSPLAGSSSLTTLASAVQFGDSGFRVGSSTIASGKGRAIGWYRIAKVGNNSAGTIYYRGSYNTGWPTSAVVAFSTTHTVASMIQIAGRLKSIFTKLRLVRDSSDGYYFVDAYQSQSYSSSQSMGTQFFTIIGSTPITMYNPTEPTDDTTEPAVDISIVDMPNSFGLGRFTSEPLSGQVVVTDGTSGGIKTTGYTIGSSVPSNAVFTDTTYTFATGDSDGQIKVTPAGGTAQNVIVKGLGSNAYTSTAYAPIESPELTGTPTAPTASIGTDTTQIATTAFVNNSIDAIDIGGRNLVLNSDVEKTSKNNVVNFSLSDYGKDLLVTGAVFTVSFDVKVDDPTNTKFDSYLRDSGTAASSASPKFDNLSTEYQRKTYTSTVTKNGILTIAFRTTAAIGNGNTAATFTFRRVKVEIGNKVTDWTPAPEDFVENDFTQGRALISNASGDIDVSSVTSTELGYLSGVTSSVQTQFSTKASLDSPEFTGIPKAPTAGAGTNTTQIATTAFVKNAVDNLVNGAPEAYDTLLEISNYISSHTSEYDALLAITNDKANASEAGASLSLNSNTLSLLNKNNTSISDVTFDLATDENDGLMSSSDKSRLSIASLEWGKQYSATNNYLKIKINSTKTGWTLSFTVNANSQNGTRNYQTRINGYLNGNHDWGYTNATLLSQTYSVSRNVYYAVGEDNKPEIYIHVGGTYGSVSITDVVNSRTSLDIGPDTFILSRVELEDIPESAIVVIAGSSSHLLGIQGGTMQGPITLEQNQYYTAATPAFGIDANNSDIIKVNSIYTADDAGDAREGINFYRDGSNWDTLWVHSGAIYFSPNRAITANTSAANSQKVGRFTENPVAGQMIISDGTSGGMKTIQMIKAPNIAYSVQQMRASSSVTEIILHTGIKWVGSRHMPSVYIHGYGYQFVQNIDLMISFYLYGSNPTIYNPVATNRGSVDPEIYIFKYTSNEIDYVAIGLKLQSACNNVLLAVDVQDDWAKFAQTDLDSSIWTWSQFNSDGNIPAVGTDACKLVPYKANILNPSKVNNHTVNSDVPLNAVFTDTTYTFDTGDLDGQIKVTPSGGDAQNIFVKGLGSAAFTESSSYAVFDHTHDVATVSSDGFMSATDKLKLDQLEIGGRNLVLNSGETINIKNTYDTNKYMLTDYGKEVIAGKTVTISMDVMADDITNHTFQAYLRSTTASSGGTNGTTPNAISVPQTSFTRVSFTTQVLDSPTMLVLCVRNNSVSGNKNSTATLSVRRVKIELGTEATDWTPAPEDSIQTIYGDSDSNAFDALTTLGGLTLRSIGTAIPANSNLNTYMTPGVYYSENAARSATITNTPTTESGFKLYVIQGYVSSNGMQIIRANSVNKLWKRYWQSNGQSWSKWFFDVVSESGKSIGGLTQPIYINSTGEPTALSYTIEKSVPSDAVFTDTTDLSDMTGTLSINKGGTGANTALDAVNNLGSFSHFVGDSGATIIPSNADLDDYITTGTYYSEDSTKSGTLSNPPTTQSGFKLFVDGNYQENRNLQYAISASRMYYRFKSGASEWTSWHTIGNLFSAHSIDGVDFDGTTDIIHYGTCDTAKATAAKEVECAGFKLVTGAIIFVRFTVTNTAAVADLTLNVNSTGAIGIKYRNANLPAVGDLAANRTYCFVYDGTYYQWVGDRDTNGDTKVRQTLATADTDRPLLMAYSANTVTTTNVDNVAYRNNSIFANPSTGVITANGFTGSLTGAASLNVLKAGDTMTGTLGLEPASGSGGKIELRASTANTTQTGIVLDQYMSDFRIYGIASADGTTQTGVGAPLKINPYSKTITGDYDFSGRIYSSLVQSTTGIDYPIAIMNSGHSSGYKSPDFSTSFRYLHRDGVSSSAPGYQVLMLGNNVSSSSAGGTRGSLRIYGNGTTRTDLYSAADNNSTQNFDVYLPPISGVLMSVNGAQDINGMKKFKTTQCFVQSDVTKGTAPQSTQYREIICTDASGDVNHANGKRLGLISFQTSTSNENCVRMTVYKPSGTTESQNLAIYWGATGDAYTSAPTPGATDNSTKIATTAYVKGLLRTGTANATTTNCPNGCFYFQYV